MSSDGPGDISHVAGFANPGVQDLEDEARRIMARGAGPNTRSPITTTEDLPLPFRVLRNTDPSIWSVRVKVGVLLYCCQHVRYLQMTDSSDMKPMLCFRFAADASSLAQPNYQQLRPLSVEPLFQDTCLLKHTTSAKFIMQWMALLLSATSNPTSLHRQSTLDYSPGILLHPLG